MQIKVESITNSGFEGQVHDWANENSTRNPEVSDGHIGGQGIAIDLNRGNIGTHQDNPKPDGEGGSAITIMHGAGHSSEGIQGQYGRRGEGDKEGHTSTGVMADGNQLIRSFNNGGASGIIKQNNGSYLRAMMSRYGTTPPPRDNYQRKIQILTIS